MPYTIDDVVFPNFKNPPAQGTSAPMSNAQAANTIEHCKIHRYRLVAIFCLGFLFGAFIGFCGTWIIFAAMNGG